MDLPYPFFVYSSPCDPHFRIRIRMLRRSVQSCWPEDLKPWHYMLSRHVKTGWRLTWLQNGWTGVIAKIKANKVCHSPRGLSKKNKQNGMYVEVGMHIRTWGCCITKLLHETKWNYTQHMWPSTKPPSDRTAIMEMGTCYGHLKRSLFDCVCQPFSSTRRIFVQLCRSKVTLTSVECVVSKRVLILFLIPFTSFDPLLFGRCCMFLV